VLVSEWGARRTSGYPAANNQCALSWPPHNCTNYHLAAARWVTITCSRLYKQGACLSSGGVFWRSTRLQANIAVPTARAGPVNCLAKPSKRSPAQSFAARGYKEQPKIDERVGAQVAQLGWGGRWLVASARAATACRRYNLGTLFAIATGAWRALFEWSALSSLWPRQAWTNRGWARCRLLRERDNAMLTSGNSADLLSVGRQNQPAQCDRL